MVGRARLGTVLVFATALIACSKKTAPATTPVPEPAVAGARSTRGNDDGARAEAARRDSIAREERLRAERAAAAKSRAALTATVYFAYDESNLSDDARRALAAKASALRSAPDTRLRISGHADERGSDEYNIALGQRRAASAKRYLTDLGIDPGRLQTVSYGEARPVCTQPAESCWSLNRRAEFEIVAGSVTMGPP